MDDDGLDRAAQAMIAHLQWRLDCLDRATSDMRGRAGVLVGLAGVEIGTISARGQFNSILKYIALTFLIIAIIIAVLASYPNTIHLGNVVDLQQVTRGDAPRETLTIIREQLLKAAEDDPKESPIEQMLAANSSTSKKLKWAYRFTAMSQIFIVLSFIPALR